MGNPGAWMTPQFSQFSCSVMSNFSWPHGLQQARLPCPSPTPRACSKSCPSSQWCHPNISSSVVAFPSHLQSFPISRVFSNELVIFTRWAKYWSFSISPSSEYSGLISFRIDWFHLLVVPGTLQSFHQHHSSKSINSSAFSLLYCPSLTSIHRPRLTNLMPKIKNLLIPLSHWDFRDSTVCSCALKVHMAQK